MFKMTNKVVAFERKNHADGFKKLYQSSSKHNVNIGVQDINRDTLIQKCTVELSSLLVFDENLNETIHNDIIFVIVYYIHYDDQNYEIGFEDQSNAILFKNMINILFEYKACYVAPVNRKTMIKWCEAEKKIIKIL